MGDESQVRLSKEHIMRRQWLISKPVKDLQSRVRLIFLKCSRENLSFHKLKLGE